MQPRLQTEWRNIFLNQRFFSSCAYQGQILLQIIPKIPNHQSCTKKSHPVLSGPDSEILDLKNNKKIDAHSLKKNECSFKKGAILKGNFIFQPSSFKMR